MKHLVSSFKFDSLAFSKYNAKIHEIKYNTWTQRTAIKLREKYIRKVNSTKILEKYTYYELSTWLPCNSIN